MTKAKAPKPDRNRKAPAENQTVAPSARNRTKQRPTGTKTGPNAAKNDSKSTPFLAKKTESPEKNPFGARISRRAADRLRAGHVWVYASDVELLELGDSTNAPALLPVADYRGVLLGTALYSPTSQIALRLVSRDAIGEAEWLKILEERLRKAARRRKLSETQAVTSAWRVCFSEADELPGLVVDKYGDLVILQLLARGLDSAAVREVCVRALREELENDKFPISSILERPDPRIRELEGLSAPSLAPLWTPDPDRPVTQIVFRLNGLEFHFDANAGQKTGAFLDQRVNYESASFWARSLNTVGRALDVCTYQGGFALHLARYCKQVTGLDASRASLEVAEKNLELNRNDSRQIRAEVDWVEGDAFEILRDWAAAREQFDTIVLDPPAFAKSKRAVEGALRGYKELNLRAMQMLRPHGLLVTCSCSHHVSLAEFEAVVAAAAGDAHRRVRLLDRRGAAPDHPVLLNIPETEYLKCLMLEVE